VSNQTSGLNKQKTQRHYLWTLWRNRNECKHFVTDYVVVIISPSCFVHETWALSCCPNECPTRHDVDCDSG